MVRPGVVGATTGAGVGLPLLLFVVILFSSQTQAAVTLLNVTPIPTSSPSITRRYLTAATTTKTTTTTKASISDILWKSRDLFNVDAIKPRIYHQSLSSSPSLDIHQRPNDSSWIENLRVFKQLGWKGGEGQINHKPDNWNWLGRKNSKGVKVARHLSFGRTDQANGNVDNLSDLRTRPGQLKTGTTLITKRITGTEQATESIGRSEVFKEREKVDRTGWGETKGVRKDGVVQVQVKNVSGEITTSVDVFVGDSGVEWTTASTVTGPMSSLSYPREAQGAGRVRIYLGPKQKRPEEKAGDTKVTSEGKDVVSSSIASTTQTATTELSPPTRDTSMEACK